MMTKTCLIIFCLFLSAAGLALEVPALTGPVMDLAGVLNRNEEAELSKALHNYKQKFGPQVQVLTVSSLEGDVIENFSIQVVDQWKLGDQKRQDGVLLLLALNDRKVRIEVGRGLEGTLTDLQTSRIIRQMSPYFKEGHYAEGIVSGLSSILATLGGELENVPLKKELKKREGVVHGFPIIMIILFFIFFIAKMLTGTLGTAFGRGLGGRYYSGSGRFGGGGFSSGGGGWSGGGGGFAGGGSSGSW